MRRMLLSYCAGLAFLLSSSPGAADAAETTLTIKGMTCGGCVAAVKLQLRKTDGVTAYDVSLEKEEAEVTYDSVKTDPEKIAESVSKTGFVAAVKESTGKTRGSSAAVAKTGPTCSGPSCQRDSSKAERQPAADQSVEAPGLVNLAAEAAPLASAFNAARTKPRFLAILSPTCPACVHGAEAVKAAALPVSDAIDVFVVWAPMLDGDDAAAASARSRMLAGPRVRQYWDPARRVGSSFRKDVFPDAVERMRRSLPKDHFFAQYLAERDTGQPEWDIYAFFEAGADWRDRAPTPDRWVRQTARFAKGESGELTSLLWINDYAKAPIEGSLTEQLRRLAPQLVARGAVR